MHLKERLRLKWVYFTAYMRYLYGKLKDGPYICEDCEDIIDKNTVIEHIYANLTREEMICKSCIMFDDYYPEDYMDPEDYEEYGESYIDDEDEYWPHYGD